jgi:hypothetical protein
MAEGRSWSRCCDTWIGAVEETFDQPVASARAGHARLTEAPEAGRLERAGLSPRVADVVRRTLRRYPDFSDGWAEWPGTLTDLDPRVREGFRVALSRETA